MSAAPSCAWSSAARSAWPSPTPSGICSARPSANTAMTIDVRVIPSATLEAVLADTSVGTPSECPRPLAIASTRSRFSPSATNGSVSSRPTSAGPPARARRLRAGIRERPRPRPVRRREPDLPARPRRSTPGGIGAGEPGDLGRVGQQLGVELVSTDGAVALGPAVERRLAILEDAGVPARAIGQSELSERLVPLDLYEGPAMLDEAGGALRVRAAIAVLTAQLGDGLVSRRGDLAPADRLGHGRGSRCWRTADTPGSWCARAAAPRDFPRDGTRAPGARGGARPGDL